MEDSIQYRRDDVAWFNRTVPDPAILGAARAIMDDMEQVQGEVITLSPCEVLYLAQMSDKIAQVTRQARESDSKAMDALIASRVARSTQEKLPERDEVDEQQDAKHTIDAGARMLGWVALVASAVVLVVWFAVWGWRML